MAIELTLSNGGELEFKSGLPADYNGPILRGANGFSAKTNIAHLVVQELNGEHYSIRFSIAKFLKTVSATGHLFFPGLYSYFMLNNNLRKEFDSLGKLHIREDHYVCLFTGATACKVHFEKNVEYRALDLFYSPQLLQELVPFFPELQEVLTSSPGMILPGRSNRTLPSMQEITQELLNCNYDEATRQFYFDLKVRELLYQLLVNAYSQQPTDLTFTPWEKARIYDAQMILQAHIDKKPPSIKALSKQVALNEFKLKNGFRYYFNVGIFEWLMEEKMKHARELLLNTDKRIKQIAFLVGYPRTTNFITAFRRRFGVTPGSLRRK